MKLRFVTKEMHAYLDYPVALSLMILPIVFGLGASMPAAKWLAVCSGAAAFVLTLFTDHKLGVFRILPYAFHLAVDSLVGLVFRVAPSALGFVGPDAWYYWANGAAVLLVCGLHRPEEEESMITAHSR